MVFVVVFDDDDDDDDGVIMMMVCFAILFFIAMHFPGLSGKGDAACSYGLGGSLAC